MSTSRLERHDRGWRICCGGLDLQIDRKTGCLVRLAILRDREHVWTEHDGDVLVRDDRLERVFGKHHLHQIHFEETRQTLIIKKRFHGAPWLLTEIYRLQEDVLEWDATVSLDSGEYRSCEIVYSFPWHLPLHPMRWWAATEHMPSAPHRFAGISLEYAEICAGILIPALVCYRSDLGFGLMLVMPFEFQTPRFRFLSGYRDRDLQVSFDWLALAPGKPAQARFWMRGCEPDWRPALGWLYERYREYFEPRSPRIHDWWGGHISGRWDVTVEEARRMAALGMKWHEVHGHFPAYGEYHPENLKEWRSGHYREDPTIITVESIRQGIRNLHEAGIAALLYMQLSGDGDCKLLSPRFDDDRVRDWHGDLWSSWPGTYLMNSDPRYAFGKDITRQINGIVERYPEMDGIFVDQPCYSFLDTAHDDGITAVRNKPCYITGFNFISHLEHLSRLLHPQKVIIGNGPFAIWQVKYMDGVMAEGVEWLIDKLQYYSIGRKPLYFLEYRTDDRRIERMFQQAIRYGCGFSSYPQAWASKDLFDRYIPVVERLYRRRWVFEADPLRLPEVFDGNVYRSERGTLVASVVSRLQRLGGRQPREATLGVRCAEGEKISKVLLFAPGNDPQPLRFSQKESWVETEVPSDLAAGVVEFFGENMGVFKGLKNHDHN